MQPLFTQTNFKNAKSTTKLSLKCKGCNETFFRQKRTIQSVMKGQSLKNTLDFCSHKCQGKTIHPPIYRDCSQCGQQTKVKKSTIEKSKTKNFFCSRSCAATYNNLHKTTGTRRSKLEVWIEQQLDMLYPDLDIEYNDKEAISSELDIYIPSFSFAFELNGIYHYEPIHGVKKFSKIQKNDINKYQECIKKNISLCIIDVSSQKYFKPNSSKKFLSIITQIIDELQSLS